MRRALLAWAAAALPVAAAAEEPLPQWEFGVGATALHLPDYRGSNESRNYLYPLPYIVYRGDKVRVDRQGARAVLLERSRVELDFSVFGTLPVDSSKNRARQGMPDLDPTIEVGPQVNVSLLRSSDSRLDLRFPVRAVVATDLRHSQGAGFTFYPHLFYGASPDWSGGRWTIGVNAGPLFASSDYHRYFYSVDPQFATPDRPAFEAKGGYSGIAALGSISRRYGKTWVAAFARYDNLNGAVFENSPLVKQSNTFSVGVAFAWVFAESDRKVEGRD
jgi:outer membrane scaffolding protein for murein synthesis (MipA/OmpV family)